MNNEHILHLSTLNCDARFLCTLYRETHLDKKILSALLKGNNMDLNAQLNLALIWNRVDLAEEKILVGESLTGISGIDGIMMDAISMERINFIELLVMNGFVMRTFLTVERLRELYNRSVSFSVSLWVVTLAFPKNSR